MNINVDCEYLAEAFYFHQRFVFTKQYFFVSIFVSLILY